MSTQNVNVACFARNVEWDFFCDFQTPWLCRFKWYRILFLTNFFRHLQIGSCNVSFKNYPGFFTPCSFWLIFVERKRSAFDDRSCSIIHLEFFRRERLYKKTWGRINCESVIVVQPQSNSSSGCTVDKISNYLVISAISAIFDISN